MIKFKVEPVTGRVYEGRNLRLWVDRHYQDINAEELSALHSCIGAAMAESNTQPECSRECEIAGEPICAQFTPSTKHPALCGTKLPTGICLHFRACHQPQEPARGNEQ